MGAARATAVWAARHRCFPRRSPAIVFATLRSTFPSPSSPRRRSCMARGLAAGATLCLTKPAAVDFPQELFHGCMKMTGLSQNQRKAQLKSVDIIHLDLGQDQPQVCK